MITVPEVTEEVVRHSPFLEKALAEDLINLSALARKIQPYIQDKLLKDIKLGAIVMALKRLSKKFNNLEEQKLQQILGSISDITVRSNIVEFTFINSPTLIEKQKMLLEEISPGKSIFFTVTTGVYETSIFISQSFEATVKGIYKEEPIRNSMSNLSAITLIIPKEATFIPGVYYSVLKALAWDGISFVEIVSSFTELTIILEDSEVERAFSAIKNLSSFSG